MEPAHLDLRIPRGMTWRKPFTIMQPTFVYKPITAIKQDAKITVSVTHDLPASCGNMLVICICI